MRAGEGGRSAAPTEVVGCARGRRVAAVLQGGWRADPPPFATEVADLASVEDLLHFSGSAALVWPRLKATALATTPLGQRFRQAFRFQAMEAAVRRRLLIRLFEAFRTAGIEPILGKGWAAARLYPAEALRPYVDFDLTVGADERAKAALVARDLAADGCAVDIHAGFPALADRPTAEIVARSRLVHLDGTAIRVLGPEDHLRLLCLHMLGHGAWRPLWLCDVAAAVETRPPSFDWTWACSGEPWRTRWVRAALLLARDLLGASLEGVPAELAFGALPRWVGGAVLRAWGHAGRQSPQGSREPMARLLRNPARALRGLWIRWPNPIEASLGVGVPPGRAPRWPIQVAECVRRMVRFAAVPSRAAPRSWGEA